MIRILPLIPVFALAGCQALAPEPEAAPTHPACAQAQAAPWSAPQALATAPSLAQEPAALAEQPKPPAGAGGAHVHSHHGEGGGE